MPKVSVLVPIYNVEKYLQECLESIINQTLEDIEIICINDGSTDSSPDILKEFAEKDNRIKVINKINSGYGASMNMGLDAATGEYIGIVESDDFIKPKMFESLYNIAKKNSSDIVKSDFYFYTTANNQHRKAGIIQTNNENFNIKNNLSILKLMPTIWSAIYRTEFLKNNCIRFNETAGASYQDTSFAFMTLVSAERISFTTNAYLNYRSDNENSSVKSKNKVYCICDEFAKINEFLDKNPDIKNYVNNFKIKLQFNKYKWNAIRISEELRDDFIERFQNDFKSYYENGEMKSNKELRLLFENPKEFRQEINKQANKLDKKIKRRKRFSVKISLSRISIVLFGKHILEIG